MQKLSEGLRITGRITIDTYRTGMVAAATPILDEIRFLKSGAYVPGIKERLSYLKAYLRDIRAAFHLRTAVECPNLIMDSANYGLDLIIQRLVGNNTYSLNLMWIEIGTGSTTPSVNDTALTTPSVRAAVSYQEDFATTDAIVQAYITDGNLPNTTYQEVGSFVDGTASIGSGQIFNHALLSPTYTKVSGEDTTLQVDITLSNS